jgi:hypothetical protein
VEHMGRDARGRYVTHADHLADKAAAVAEARQIAYTEGQEREREMAAPGFALALDEAERRGREFVLSVWKQDGYDEEKRMAHMYEQGQVNCIAKADALLSSWVFYGLISEKSKLAFLEGLVGKMDDDDDVA